MIIWMLWAIAFAALIGVAALALERVAACFGVSRRQIWMVAVVVAAIVPPFLATQRRTANVVDTTPAAIGSQISVVDGALNVRTPAPASAKTAELAFPPAPAGSTSEPFPDRWALVAWLAASLLLAGFFARTMVRLRNESVAWPETEVESYRALVAPNAGPAVIGFTRPRIVIPAWALALDRPARELMLRHEMEHIRAHDPRTLLAAGALLVVFPWNVALWVIVRQLRRAMELDCDARVIRAVGNPSEYGRVLLAVGERYTSSLPLAAALSEPRPLLEQRIDAMTAPRPRRPLRAALPFLALAVLVTVAATRAPRPAPLPPLVFALASAPAQAARDTAHIDRSLKPVTTRIDPQRGLDLQGGMHLTLADTEHRARVDSVPAPVMAVLERERVVAIAKANFPGVLRGEEKADFVLLVFDAANNYVWGFPGTGSVMIHVAGDTLSSNQRRALQRSVEQASGVASGSSGRGGRGGGTGAAVTPGQRTDYAVGFMTHVRLDGSGEPAVNQSSGLGSASGTESGIVGIAASSVMYVDQFRLSDPNLTLSRLEILAVHLTSAAPMPSQVVDTTPKKKAKVKQLVIFPVPVPSTVGKPFTMEACFDVASNGDAKLLVRTKSRDSAYDRKIEESLRQYLFTPATVNGVAVRDTTCIRAIAN